MTLPCSEGDREKEFSVTDLVVESSGVNIGWKPELQVLAVMSRPLSRKNKNLCSIKYKKSIAILPFFFCWSLLLFQKTLKNVSFIYILLLLLLLLLLLVIFFLSLHVVKSLIGAYNFLCKRVLKSAVSLTRKIC